MPDPLQSIEMALAALPAALSERSGSIFYSGRDAFSAPCPLYLLGLNPGGSPVLQAEQTIGRDRQEWPDRPSHWSRYLDESWLGNPPGTHGMQPRIGHMFGRLGLDLRRVPASNVVFVRTASERMLAAEKAELLASCWPVHEAVIRALEVRAVLCLGKTAGRWVRDALGAQRLLGTFRETNGRGWQSEAHSDPAGRTVITVTHPSRADWRNPEADPTPFVRSVLDS